MANIHDYLAWRGDLPMTAAPMCEVDNLIFSLISYIDWKDIVPPPGEGHISLRNAAKEYFFRCNRKRSRPLGLVIPAGILSLFRTVSKAPRFRSLELCGYVNEISRVQEKQFSALTVRLPNEAVFVAFRGTDDTLIGWREDFNLSFLDCVPSQCRAVEYLNALDLPPDAALYIGGHSKGGNLAVWGAVHACDRVKRQIKHVWSNDGPGFSEKMIKSKAYRDMSKKFTFLLPTDSVIGLLLEHDEAYEVIRSTQRGLRQHDGMSWEVQGDRFLRTDGLSRRAIRSDAAVRHRIALMSKKEKETLVRMLFDLLESTGAKTLTDLNSGSFRTISSIIRSVAGLSPEEREAGLYLLRKLFLTRVQTPKPQKPPKHGKLSPVQVKFRWDP